ncbi:hypothetical protein OM076_43265 [Solirubrobacter ginsenosidimutans]|uniref:NAD(P)/FAD-dependent oxidoreductase n=1 Tax=Solirubrobacter ginsenosidimutans TaxID=490573 RepID=A0A9X3S5V2_9ACTN|nr:hypothetical protein [Solirubrobacter ginsenosidimutans]MDA0167159.1 hypothetical protein [Solirubrobacter ginsenosidimutans]
MSERRAAVTEKRAVPHVRAAVIGAGLTGVSAGVALKSQGIDEFVILEPARDLGSAYPIAAENGLNDRLRVGQELRGATWDEAHQRWSVSTTELTLTADILIDAAGPLTESQLPPFPGFAGFPGLIFHAGRWDYDHALDGERVAVIGTDVSAVQRVPEIQPRVGRLIVVQRTPGFEVACKRAPIADDWYRALARPNVDVVAGGVRSTRGRTLIAQDGSKHDVDTIILGTGFAVLPPPLSGRIRGRGDRVLADVWHDTRQHYRAVEIAGFPNYFRLSRFMIGPQTAYLRDVLRAMDQLGLASVEVSERAQDDYMASECRETARTAGALDGWYRRLMRRFAPSDHRLVAARVHA